VLSVLVSNYATPPNDECKPRHSDHSTVSSRAKTIALGFCGFAHSIQGLPHTSGPLLAQVKSRDGSPDSGTIGPTRRDASAGTKSPVVEEDDGMDADPCCVTATAGDASVVSSPV
jgi:hypothetical protein